MKRKLFLFIFIPILLTTFGEFVLKHTINTQETKIETSQLSNNVSAILNLSEQNNEKLTAIVSVFKSCISSPKIILATVCIISGGILWLIAMSKFELSFLYPFLSINYICIIIGSQLLLKEEVSIFRYFSIVLIIIGLIIISKSPYSESHQEERK
jgi:multidrug transporter EmrE-like cation transporter